MNDTPPEVRDMVRQKLMERSHEERFLMGIRMFDAARQMVLASLPKNLPAPELRRQLFQRIYRQPAPFEALRAAPGQSTREARPRKSLKAEQRGSLPESA